MTDETPDIDAISTEDLQHKLAQLTVANDNLTADILGATGSMLDTDGLQIEALLRGLVAVGVITDRQETLIQLAWAQQHHNMLRTAIAEIKKHAARQQLLKPPTMAEAQAAAKLHLPGR